MLSGLQEAYDSMQSHDTNTLYFCTDTQRYFIGDVEYSRPVQHGTSLPSTYLPPNSLFYNTNTRQLFFSKDGASWQVISCIPSINGVELNGELTSSDLDIEPARFIVNVTPSGSSFTADHTYEELVEAYNEGRTIQAVVSGITWNLAQFLSGVRFEFSFTDLQYMEYAILRISASNAITLTVTDRVATSSQIGGVLVANYDESTHSSQRIAMDSSKYLHAPKTSINGVELTNSTTAEDLSLQRAGMVITVTFSHHDENTPSIWYYTSDTTFQQIQDFHTSYPDADIICQTNTGMKYNLFGINSSSVLFTRDSLQSLSTASITINSDDIVINETTTLRASSSLLGGVYALDYNESDYSSTQIAIDSTGFLHSPKLSINGKELTNSTTAEELNLKRADFVINVVQSERNYIADKTIDQIQGAYESGLDVVAVMHIGATTSRMELSSFFQSGNTAVALFQEYDPSLMDISQLVISKINETTSTVLQHKDAVASNNLGGVRAPEYDESTYTPTQVAIDSTGYLHAPKSIFTVTVTANETADMTFEQIQSAYNNGYYVQASYVGRNIPLVQLTGSTAYFRLFISEDTSDANLGMVYDIKITSTSVNVSTGYMRATSTQYGLIRADSDTYDETYTKECKMNDADGKLYTQPTMWSFWD